MTTERKTAVSYLHLRWHTSGQERQARRWARYPCLPLVMLAAVVLSHSIAAEPTKEVRRILMLNEAGTSYPAITIINQGIQNALDDSPYRIEFYPEYLDNILFPAPDAQQEFRHFYIHKHQNRKPDVIITVGPSPLEFMEEEHQRGFPGLPIVVCLPTGPVPGTPAVDSDFTGVENDIAPAKTLEIALRLQPGTEHVVVVSGLSDFDRLEQAYIKGRLQGFTGHIDIAYMTDLAMPELLERLRHLPSHTLVLFTSVSQDAAVNHFKSSETGAIIVAVANTPVSSLFDLFLNHGEAGGYLSTLSEQGKFAGSMALRLLKGDKPRDIPLVKGVNTYMFDWRALKRWGLKDSSLPPDSIVLNRQLTVWEAYPWYIISGIALILAETMLVFALFWQWDKRRKSERYCRTLVLRSPLAMVVTHRPGCRNKLVNHKYTELFGYTIEDVPDEDHWWRLAYPNEAYRDEIKAEWQRRVEGASIKKRGIDSLEASVCCKDGSYRHVEVHFASIDGSDLVEFVDLTDRRRAEVQLRESEERFRLVANTAPVMIWMSGMDRKCSYVNKTWLDFTGRPLEAELGDDWTGGLHPDDSDRCLRTYTEAFDQRESFEMQYRFRRHDGEYRWVLDKGVPRFNPDGTFAGYIGSCIDITERKHAEEAMSTIGRRLIEAHEEERTWIGRELHDDINQRLALLGVELDRWGQHIPSGDEFIAQVRHAQERIMQISRDVQGLSHRLHSSRLEYLGLVTAASSFCKELSRQSKVEVHFSHAGIPRSMPKEVSLCLFRVLQEALQNAVKHSGVRSFTVDLHGTEDAIELTVSDTGSGFEEQEAFTRDGLGLISMRERLQLVHGELSVKSRTGAGTTIHARVPLTTHECRAIAG